VAPIEDRKVCTGCDRAGAVFNRVGAAADSAVAKRRVGNANQHLAESRLRRADRDAIRLGTAGETSAVLRLFASPSAQPGTWKVAATASTTGGSYYLGAGRIRVSSALVDLSIAEPYIALKNKPAAVRRGETSQVVWDVEHKKPFAGEAEAVLLGLPKGVTTVEPTPKLRTGDKQLVFEVAAGSEALLGQYKELTCEIVVRQAGQEIRQRTGKGILRVDPALISPAEASVR
jgi:hypothetical protein